MTVFSLDRKYLNSINERIKSPWSVAAFEDNKSLVCDGEKHVINVLQ